MLLAKTVVFAEQARAGWQPKSPGLRCQTACFVDNEGFLARVGQVEASFVIEKENRRPKHMFRGVLEIVIELEGCWVPRCSFSSVPSNLYPVYSIVWDQTVGNWKHPQHPPVQRLHRS